jgi:hypothetical protein
MRTIIIGVLARIGSWCCHKSIEVAGSGYIEFEVATPRFFYNTENIYKPQKRRTGLALFMVLMYVLALVKILSFISTF